MIILGIDPGTATTGYGVIEIKDALKEASFSSKRYHLIKYGCIITPKNKNQGERLCMLERGLTKLFLTYHPDAVAVERLYFFKNLKTAMPVSEARGVVLLVAAKKKVLLQEFTPLQAKMTITGYGRAEKKQIQQMVQKLLSLPVIPKPDDAADALALAITCSLSMRTLKRVSSQEVKQA